MRPDIQLFHNITRLQLAGLTTVMNLIQQGHTGDAIALYMLASGDYDRQRAEQAIEVIKGALVAVPERLKRYREYQEASAKVNKLQLAWEDQRRLTEQTISAAVQIRNQLQHSVFDCQ